MSLIFVHFWEEIDHQRNDLPLFSWMYDMCYLYKQHHRASTLLHILNSFSCIYICRPHYTYITTNIHQKFLHHKSQLTLYSYPLTISHKKSPSSHPHPQFLSIFQYNCLWFCYAYFVSLSLSLSLTGLRAPQAYS